jgi:hypothetical protein
VSAARVSTMVDTTVVAAEFDPWAVVRLVMVALAKAGVPHIVESESVGRIYESAARLLWSFGVEATERPTSAMADATRAAS